MAVFVYTFCQPIPKKSSRDYLSLPRATAGRLHPWYPCQLLDDKGLAPCRSGGAPSGACCLHRFLYCAEWRRDMRTLRDCCPLFWLVVPDTRTRASRTFCYVIFTCLCIVFLVCVCLLHVPCISVNGTTQKGIVETVSPRFVNHTAALFCYWATRVHSCGLTMYVNLYTATFLVACMWFLIVIILDRQVYTAVGAAAALPLVGMLPCGF